MSSWQPSPDSLKQLAACLKDSLSGINPNAQRQAEMMLKGASTSPDFNNYLAYIFSSSEPPEGVQLGANDYHVVRAAAAIMVKNNVKSGFKTIPESSLALIKMAVPIGIQDKNAQIRNYAGNIATEIIHGGGLASWPDLLPQLLDTMTNASGQVAPEAQEGAASAMAKICEDNVRSIQTQQQNGSRPLQFILPKLIDALKSPLVPVRTNALSAINVFTERKTQVMLNAIDNLLLRLFELANDNSPNVRRQVCRAFVNIVNLKSDKISPHIGGLVDYIINQQRSDDEDLACEAGEFWLTVGEHSDLWFSLTPYIDKIIPVLLECMVYSGDEIALLGAESDDEDEDDRAEDIKPVFAKKSATRNVGSKAGGAQSMNPAGHAGVYENLASMDNGKEEGEVDDDDDDEGGDASPEERWTIRKCSAASLDVFACDFKEPVFQCIMPYLTNNLKSSDWPLREAAVLALGAVADGCMPFVAPHLPELIPYLISLLEDSEPIVRKITCWTLGRYSSWAAQLKDPKQLSDYFEPIIDGLLRKMLDTNKKVQEAAASAFAYLVEKANRVLEPYCAPIIQQFVRCFGKYKDRNIYILYDCVQTLAENIGPVLARPDNVNLLMPALISRYQNVADESREVFTLLECLSYVALALNDAFAPFAEPIFGRCVRILHVNLEAVMASTANADIPLPDKDFLITSLDLLSAIIQCLDDDKAAELVKKAQPSFFELLMFSLENERLEDEVKQSAYALLGDASRFVFPLLQPHISSIFPALLKQLDLDSILEEEAEKSLSVINNACWAAGEIAMRHGKGMAPYVPEMLARCRVILDNELVPESVAENAAIALGRCGLENAELMAPELATFSARFLDVMSDLDPSEEKATAFQGFTMIVGQNPQAMEKVLLQFFVAIARYRDLKLRNPIKQELHDIFQHAINAYKQMIPQFDSFISQLPPDDQLALKTHYSV
jgi:transportin-1